MSPSERGRGPEFAPTRVAGLLAPAATLGCVLAATVVAPEFSWTGDALSDLGVGARTAPLFNGGLLVGGLLALPYAVALGRAARGTIGRAAATGFALAAVAMGLVGAFPTGHPLHLPAAVAFYLLLTATLAVDGASRRDAPTGAASLALAAVHVVVWAAWAAGVRPGPGLAIPEAVGAASLALWVWIASPAAPLRVGVRTPAAE